MRNKNNPTLIIVDVQNDFIEGGSLAVAGGDKVAVNLATHLADNAESYASIVTTQDWHVDPGNHWSETPDYTDTWPIHCAANTFGSELHNKLAEVLSILPIPVTGVVKGEHEAAYSGFEGHIKNSVQSLERMLKEEEIIDLHIVGLATDHCVRATALDALDAGFNVTLMTKYIAGVDEKRSAETLEELKEAGAIIV